MCVYGDTWKSPDIIDVGVLFSHTAEPDFLMSHIPPCSTQSRECSQSYKSTARLLSVLLHSHSWSCDSIAWKISQLTSRLFSVNLIPESYMKCYICVFHFGHVMCINYPGSSSYPQMTWNHQRRGTGTFPGCWCTGLHHRCLGSPHTRQYLKAKRQKGHSKIQWQQVK